MKILNLYAGVGGNRKLWQNAEITAVEICPKIANAYADLYPDDTLIVGDAHQYLQDNYKQFDFIWSSPPCQTHSQMRQNLCVRLRGTPAVYPDMKLYQEIIFLQHNFKGKWVVENVRPYYETLIKPTAIMDRHLFWCNFDFEPFEVDKAKLRSAQIPDLQEFFGIDLSAYKIPEKRQVLRNCVNPLVGNHIFKSAMEE